MMIVNVIVMMVMLRTALIPFSLFPVLKSPLAIVITNHDHIDDREAADDDDDDDGEYAALTKSMALVEGILYSSIKSPL